jgi:hypothetical protein
MCQVHITIDSISFMDDLSNRYISAVSLVGCPLFTLFGSNVHVKTCVGYTVTSSN